MATVESLYKQMLDLHVNIAPESYSTIKNYKKYIEEKLKSHKLYEHIVDKKLVGFAMYYIHKTPKRKTMCITDFAVDESERGNGHGKKILNELHNIAKTKKCNQIQLMVAFKNIPAKTLYESFGYKPSSMRMYKEI